MKKSSKSAVKLLLVTIVLTVGMSVTSWAGKFVLVDYNEYGMEVYKYKNDDGTYLKNGWETDNFRYYYYFGEDGTNLYNTTTPDGYTVNKQGLWTIDGVVQKKAYEKDTRSIGWYMSSYRAGGIGRPFYGEQGSGLENILITPTSGIVGYAPSGTAFLNEGIDHSIFLDYDPSGGDLRPNWEYSPYLLENPDTENSTIAPPLLCMNKNAYGFWNLSIDGYYKEVEGIDTTGSWIYDTTRTPTGNGWPIYYNMELVNYVGTITPWRYRFIDGTYAANGRYSIYSFTSHDEGNSYMSGDYCYFNEVGYLVVDTPKEGNVFYLDSYGRLTDVVFGLQGSIWNYKD